jgi:hypothetical protein
MSNTRHLNWYGSPLIRAIGTTLVFFSLVSLPVASHAQNLGKQPATGQAVQGEQASQPEGAFLNLVDWIGNVICPVGAALAIVGCVISWRQGRGYMPWALTAGGLLAVSALTRLAEFFIANGQQIG